MLERRGCVSKGSRPSVKNVHVCIRHTVTDTPVVRTSVEQVESELELLYDVTSDRVRRTKTPQALLLLSN